MCERKPGPRCSAHARSAYEAAEKDLKRAEGQLRDGLQGFADPSELPALREAVILAKRKADEAEETYLTTPRGANEFEARIEEAEALGAKPEDVAIARMRLEQARETREQQKRDLAASVAAEERVSGASGEAKIVLDGADMDVAQLETEDASLAEEEEQLTSQIAAGAEERATRNRRFAQRYADLQSLAQKNERTLRAMQSRLEAHYEAAAGIPEGEGDYDLGEAFEVQKRLGAGDQPDIVALPTLDTPTGDSRGDRLMREAIQRFESDPRVGRLVATMRSDLEEYHQLNDAHEEDFQSSLASRSRFARQTNRAKEIAERRQALGRELDKARQERSVRRALVGSGVNAYARGVDLRSGEAARSIVREPDGSINAWSYQEPSPGFPDGRALKVTGVMQQWGSSGPNNVLVLENGDMISANRHESGMGSFSHGKMVWIEEPSAQGVPLAEETPAGVSAGYTNVIDSSD